MTSTGVHKPAAYMKRPVQVDAMQVLGWNNAWEIHQWLNEIGGAFFVGEEAEFQQFRYQHEYDRSNGHVVYGAPAFLVIDIDGVATRVDRFSWVVREGEGRYAIFTDEEFKNQFVREEEEPTDG